MTGGRDRAVRRLRFDYHVRRDESIIGAVASAVRGHVLEGIRVVLREARLPELRPGLVQFAAREDLARLSHVIRADADALAANAGERVKGSTVKQTHQRIRFGDLTLFRSDLETSVRRISPLALRKSDYHRVHWLNRLLPYDPETLERLVDTCSSCEKALGWITAWGIGMCEHCREPVRPSSDAPLPEESAADYRLFARMVSPVPSDRASARAELPDGLQEVDWSTVITLGCKLAAFCRPDPLDKLRLHALSRRRARAVGSVTVQAASFLRTWPDGFRTWAEREAERRSGDRNAYADLRRALNMAAQRSVFPQHAELIRAAIPGLTRSVSRSWAKDDRYYLTAEAARKIGLKAGEFARLDDAEPLAGVRLPRTEAKRRARFDAGEIERLADVFRGALPMSACARALWIPNHGAEQLTAMGLLEVEDDRAVAMLRAGVRVRQSSLDDLVERLRRAARKVRLPIDAIALSRAATRIGGRVKPYGPIFDALLQGSLPYWLASQKPDARSILVRPGDLAAFDRVTFSTASFPTFSFDELIEQAGASRLLNTGSPEVNILAREAGLAVIARGDQLCMNLSDVLDLSAASATSAEIRWHLRVHAVVVRGIMKKMRITPSYLGWSRRELVAAGVLPC